jgi:hypothetical protein
LMGVGRQALKCAVTIRPLDCSRHFCSKPCHSTLQPVQKNATLIKVHSSDVHLTRQYLALQA